LSSLFFTRPGMFAQALTQTPAQTRGPYYPDRLPLDLDNDLIRINDNITPAIGEISWVSGKVLGPSGQPLHGALVEIWQADNNGAYIHSQSPIANRDSNFQGYGKFLTGSTGEYVFRTVKPGLYPGRTRHIHFQITPPGASANQTLVTQLYVQGDPLNDRDGVLNGIRDAAQRNSVIVPWTAIPGSPTGDLAAKFDIVMGFTPADPPAGRPSIESTNGVVNGAGYQQGITPGAWISIFGDNFSTTTRTWNAQTEIVGGKLPTSLDGVSVTINGTAVPVFYVSPSQINVQAPSDVGSGPVQVVVRNSNGASDPISATVQTVLPGFFLFPDYYVAAVRPDGSFVGSAGLLSGAATSPATPGESITLYGTGFGPTNPHVAAGEVFQGAAPLTSSVDVRIGGSLAEVRFAGLSAAGLNQLNIVFRTSPTATTT
jgi:protocatechuate 3,4-dioxygenase beta subunit